MPKALPPQPHIDWLKKTVKDELAALRERAPSAKLHEAQLAVAKDYGFASWRALKARVDALSLDGQIIAAAVEGRARDLDALLAAHPRKLAITGGRWNRPLLHLAAEEGHLPCVDVLLRHGFDVHRRDRNDNATALHWAAYGGRLDVAKRLLTAGADIDGEGDAHAVGVIGWAKCFQHVRQDVAEFLLARGAKPTIFAAVALGRADLLDKLVGADRSMLHARMSRFEHERTPLHFAVVKNSPAMVQHLLALGADPSAKDARGATPLNGAKAKTDRRIAELLIAAGAKPSERGVNRFESAIPILNVASVPASLDYYVDRLGFEKEWDWGTPPTFACVRRDEVRIFMCQGGQGQPGTWISIFVQDVDALYDDYRKRGVKVPKPPADFPWGVREMLVEDPDGHCLRMGSDAAAAGDINAATEET